MRRHRADDDAVAVDLDALQVGDAAQIDQPLGRRQPQLHRLHQALPAGEVARVALKARPRRRGWPDVDSRRCTWVSPRSGVQAVGARARRALRWPASRCRDAQRVGQRVDEAGGEPIAPASPQPFTPSGLCVHGVTVWSTLKLGRSSARGIV